MIFAQIRTHQHSCSCSSRAAPSAGQLKINNSFLTMISFVDCRCGVSRYSSQYNKSQPIILEWETMSQAFLCHGQDLRDRNGMEYSFECCWIHFNKIINCCWWCCALTHKQCTINTFTIANCWFHIVSTRQKQNKNYVHTHAATGFIYIFCDYIAHRSIHLHYQFRYALQLLLLVLRFFLLSFHSFHSLTYIDHFRFWLNANHSTISNRRNIIHFWRRWHTQTRIQAHVTVWLHLMSMLREK